MSDNWNALTDEDRQRAFASLPDMLDGFLKKWGWLHFAKAIEDICRQKNTTMEWRPEFDACCVKQEELAREFCLEIAGKRGQKGAAPDAVRLLEMAQALYEAEREEMEAKAK